LKSFRREKRKKEREKWMESSIELIEIDDAVGNGQWAMGNGGWRGTSDRDHQVRDLGAVTTGEVTVEWSAVTALVEAFIDLVTASCQ